MCTKSIEEYWDEFQSKVMSPEAGNLQRHEMRLSFYAGFTASLTAGMAITNLEDDPALAAIQQLHLEARNFVSAL